MKTKWLVSIELGFEKKIMKLLTRKEIEIINDFSSIGTVEINCDEETAEKLIRMVGFLPKIHVEGCALASCFAARSPVGVKQQLTASILPWQLTLRMKLTRC